MTDNIKTGNIAVIDIGKTNAKLVALDAASGAEIETLRRGNAPVTSGPYPHCDVDGLWHFILDGLKTLHARHGIDAIAITTHGATAALLSGDTLAMPVLDYEHAGPEETAAEYGTVRPDFSETLSPRLPVGLNLGAQLFWQARTFPEAFAGVTAIVPYPQYWAFRLTGRIVSERTSLGCHTDLWNPVEARYSSLVERMDWQERLPEPVATTDHLSPLCRDIAAATGLSEATPVSCGIHDSNASLVPYLGHREGALTVISSGTWTIAMTLGGTTGNLDPARDSLANVDALGRPVPTARFMGGREYGLIAGGNAPEPSVADAVAVIDAGIMALPSWVEGTGPFPGEKGRWHGDIDALAPAGRAAAASLYLALMTTETLTLAGQGDDIVVEGPLAQNGLYCSALATLTGVPVRPSRDATGTAKGAAMLLTGLGSGAPLPDAVAPFTGADIAGFAKSWRARARQEP
ncbi:FGGY-family carbohydrate kinase [Pelagibacterium xiamenense]|uniref:FGGY-family carbohydrate kinase n=1 Tax=Pelagibacterium xiamenense TaxID=2901140 RepID=UPI001E2EE57E|nr:FGGY family carbohydrate kinase [Pelagibacterium xiamenense]MCD7059747.1 carbohydrate kinase [Pelagibacterium xiamenense]